ncbi:MAG: anti-sigma F factor [Syntrophomonadaceae bacterium]|nr:anti-sigma F factor [Syntrophomonadaceae bacterium]
MSSEIKNLIKIEFPSRPENISFARTCAAAFAAQLDCTLEEIEEVKLVISEAISNSIIHGYDNQPDGVIILEMKLLPEKKIELMIEDYGCGIADVNQAMEPRYSSIVNRMGLGFVFMKSFTEDLQVTSEVDRGTKVRMIKTFLPISKENDL